jgi:hypothetical protein
MLDQTSLNSRRQAEMTMVFMRGGLGAALILTAFIAGHFPHSLGFSDIACGLVMIGIAIATSRRQKLRFGLVPLAVWVGFSPFILEGAGLVSFMSEALIGKTLLFASIASPEMFEE